MFVREGRAEIEREKGTNLTEIEREAERQIEIEIDIERQIKR